MPGSSEHLKELKKKVRFCFCFSFFFFKGYILLGEEKKNMRNWVFGKKN